MSSHDHESEAAQAGDSHANHEHFDGEPVNELAPDEPPSPPWLPLLGGVLLVLGGGWWLMGGEDGPREPQPPSAPTASAVSAASTATAPATAKPVGVRPVKRPKITKEQMIDLRRRAEEERRKAAGKASGAPPPGPQPPQPPGR